MAANRPVSAFALGLRPQDVPSDVRVRAALHLLDLLGTAAAGRMTAMAGIAADLAVAHMGGCAPVPILFDGRPASPGGAAMAGAFAIDAMDAHDGYKPAKGHAGCAALPSVLATSPAGERGDELLTRLVIGYEIGCRAGTALHAASAEYHSSGAWMAPTCAAIAARGLGLGEAVACHAMGIADYHGPRSPMMRCIDHPSMVKDGSGWGALAGVIAAYMAQSGFTGPPLEAETLSEGHWHDLGSRWLMMEQYVKPEPVCRWAQPAVHAALALRATHDVDPDTIERVEVRSFAQAIRLATRRPATTEEAQYALPFPVAAALSRGVVGPAEIDGDALRDPSIGSLADRVEMREDARLSARFPLERVAKVTLHLSDGRVLRSGPTKAAGDPEAPLPEVRLREKFHAFAAPVLGRDRTDAIEGAIDRLWATNADGLKCLLYDPPSGGRR